MPTTLDTRNVVASSFRVMTTTKTILILAILGYLAGIFASCENRKEPDSRYELRDRITDYADVLTTEQEDSLIVIMEQLEVKVGSQLAILTIPTLNGEEIESYSLRTANASRLGRTQYNDGVLITIALEDRKMRIEVGSGLENILKDEIVAQIIREDMAPKFQQQNFSSGLFTGIKKIAQLIDENQDRVGQEPTGK